MVLSGKKTPEVSLHHFFHTFFCAGSNVRNRSEGHSPPWEKLTKLGGHHFESWPTGLQLGQTRPGRRPCKAAGHEAARPLVCCALLGCPPWLKCKPDEIKQKTSCSTFSNRHRRGFNSTRTLKHGRVRMLAHHSAAIIHVVSVFVSVGTEVHTGRDSGKRPSFSPPQPTVTASLLMFHLFQEAKGQRQRLAYVLFGKCKSNLRYCISPWWRVRYKVATGLV